MRCALCGEVITGTWTSETWTTKAGEEIVEYFHSDWGPYTDETLTCAMQVARAAETDMPRFEEIFPCAWPDGRKEHAPHG